MPSGNEGPERSGFATVLPATQSSTVAGRPVRRSEDQVGIGRNSDLAATVVLPAFNEELALDHVLSSLFDVIDDSTEVIVVDDGSSDATAEIASRYPCRLLRHRQNFGKGAAVQTGLRHALGSFVIVMDADSTYPCDVIPQMIALSRDYDLVRCTRSDGMSNSPMVNRIGSKILDSLLKVIYHLEGFDYLSGLYGVKRDAFETMGLAADRFDLEIEIVIKARALRLRSITIPITYGARLGEKKLRPWKDGWFLLREIMAMALVYNPGLTFVLPGVMIWSLAAILMFILSRGSISTVYAIRLDVNSFIIASMGATVGFQFVVFGVAAALFGVQHGARPGKWLIILSHGVVRFWAAVAGIVSILVGLVELIRVIVPWLEAGGGDFFATRKLVLAGVLLTLGVQAIFASLFISMFARRLAKAAKIGPEERLLEQIFTLSHSADETSPLVGIEPDVRTDPNEDDRA